MGVLGTFLVDFGVTIEVGFGLVFMFGKGLVGWSCIMVGEMREMNSQDWLNFSCFNTKHLNSNPH